ncbi:MAG: DUF2797 domain-containing protein [Gammaproteobacteria bacterium]|nr:DUF2797 domain-containing protein [Gammaproteobacteria bacterium]
MPGIEGTMQKLIVSNDDPVSYALALGKQSNAQLPLNPILGSALEIRFLGSISCQFCESPTLKSYGDGYCYSCFSRLARCDLCVLSPDRCHYHKGTCREPQWGDAFCMQPHIVYLANSSGPKVGITRAGYEVGRWLDQGARQALPIMAAATRRDAGIVEVALAEHLPDRTDWRRLVSREATQVDLIELREELKTKMPVVPAGVTWIDERPLTFNYPVIQYGHRLKRLRLDEEPVISGNLIGIKGQFLLFEHGVFNVRQHTSYHVRVTASGERAASSVGGSDQMELFS